MRDFEKPNRSVSVARGGMAATSHPAATLAAVDVLGAGGNAMDAAIAAAAVQCVVEPGSTGIGGDCFCLWAPEGGRIEAFDGAGWAPQGADPDALLRDGASRIAGTSPAAITVPGAVDAWSQLSRRFGRMPFGELLAPSIALARDGYAVAPRAASDWQAMAGVLAQDANAAAIFLPNGKAPEAGDLHRQPQLADALELIAREGGRAFYEGEIAQDIVSYLRDLGGTHTLEDFARYEGRHVTPIRTRFADHEVWECPPSGQGVIALLILNILSKAPRAASAMSVERLHLEIEASKLAYSVRDAVLCDPSAGRDVTDWLLSDELARELYERIDMTRAASDLPVVDAPVHKDTVYISVVDKDRNAVSFINSIFSLFGSGRASPRFGVLLHNRGEGFSLTPGHPNRLAPRRRPLHTIIPGILTRDGAAVMSFGVMGGQYQATGHAHFLSRVLEFGYDIQAAIELPRFFPVPGTGNVEVEATMPDELREGLAALGHTLVRPARAIGGAQAVQILRDRGTLLGASDPRKDGCALGTLT